MAAIDGLAQGAGPPLRLLSAQSDAAYTAGSAPREERLAQILNQRLDNQLSRIRGNLTDQPSNAAASQAPNPPGAGQRLDILA